ncbi:MAG: murein L,D-transpeptidase catalytic domain family protein [Bacteroidetes bacterium]|nr:murein L,D-transpeptidase catalytic domain family protein [Bacteroidota bacterium]
MKRFFLMALTGLLLFFGASAAWYYSKLHKASAKNTSNSVKNASPDKATVNKLLLHASAASEYAAKNHFNTETCFFVDMAVESGKSRFFVYDLARNKILIKGLVTHGCCNKKWLTGRQYGNEAGCGCTSLGKYKIGYPYQGKFGLAYKLYGLDASNSNAFDRFVVLHSMQCVPEKEVSPYPICQSDGCPTVSPGFLQSLAGIINSSQKPVLLWILP